MMTIEEMRKLLSEEVCEVVFTKKDGSERVMVCTTVPSIFDGEAKSTAIPHNSNVTAYELGVGWRSFKADSVKSFNIYVD